MRNSNWKAKVLIIVAFMIGIGAGITVGTHIPEQYVQYRGLIVFGTIAVVSILIVFVCVKIFRIGRN